MTDPIHEQISAFLDGELPTAESELLLKRLQRDSGLRATVGRYALIGEAMRGAPSGVLPRDFAERVASAIEREDVPARAWRPVAHWLKPVAGGAIAAGVAAVALVSLRIAPSTEPQVAQQAAVQATPVEVVSSEPRAIALPSDTVPAPNPNYTAPPIRVVNSGRLANFVMAHSEYSTPLGRRNVLTGLVSDDPAMSDSDASALDAPDADARRAGSR